MNSICSATGALHLLALLHALGASAQVSSSPPTVLDCIVEPEMTIELSSAVDGIVQTISVDKSDRVKAGQVLATLEASVEQSLVNLARLRATANEEVLASQVQRDLSLSKSARVVELYEKKTVPLFEKDEAVAEARLAELELTRARSRQKMAVLELKSAEAKLKLRSIASPIDGVVVARFLHPGESVKDQPLLTLAKIDPMRVEIIAPTALFGLIDVGMEVEVTVEGRSESVHIARVSVVDSIVDAASGTFGVRLSLPNADNQVVGGVKCKARFNAAEQKPFSPQ